MAKKVIKKDTGVDSEPAADEMDYIPDVKTFESDDKWESAGFDMNFDDDFDTNGLLGIEVFKGNPDDLIFTEKNMKTKKSSKKEDKVNKEQNKNNKEFYCSVCNIQLSSQSMYNNHIKGKKHQNKMKSNQKTEETNDISTKTDIDSTTNNNIEESSTPKDAFNVQDDDLLNSDYESDEDMNMYANSDEDTEPEEEEPEEEEPEKENNDENKDELMENKKTNKSSSKQELKNTKNDKDNNNNDDIDIDFDVEEMNKYMEEDSEGDIHFNIDDEDDEDDNEEEEFEAYFKSLKEKEDKKEEEDEEAEEDGKEEEEENDEKEDEKAEEDDEKKDKEMKEETKEKEESKNENHDSCELCHVHFSNINEYYMHQKSKKHLKNVKKQEKKLEKKQEKKENKAKTQKEKDDERKQAKLDEINSIRGTDEAKDLYVGTTWDELYVPDSIKKILIENNYKFPTDIQVQCLRAFDKNSDIIGAAPTGSGKTLAFVLPIIIDILRDKKKKAVETETETKTENKEKTETKEENKENKKDFKKNQKGSSKKPIWNISTIISAPTRELCIQIHNVIQQFTMNTDIKTACIVGGLSEQKQIRLIQKCPDIIIGTVGRLWWLFDEKHVRYVNISHLKHFVLDEADKMVVKGSFPELSKLVRVLKNQEERIPNPNRKTYLFSATLSLSSASVSADSLKELMSTIAIQKKQQICVASKTVSTSLQQDETHTNMNIEGETNILPSSLTCFYVKCPGDKEKENFVYSYVQKYRGHTLVFVNSIHTLKDLYGIYSLLHIPVYRLHAGLQQKQRINTINKYKSTKDSVLLCTDVASRGIDIPDVTCVIHYHMPFSPQLFVHRSGRTARAGKEGVCISLVSQREQGLYGDICAYIERKNGFTIFPNDDLMINNRVNKDRLTLCHEIYNIEHNNNRKQHDNLWIQSNKRLLDSDDTNDQEEEESDENNNNNSKKNQNKKNNTKNNENDIDNDIVELTKEEKTKLKVLKRNLENALKNQNSLLPYRGSFITNDSAILETLRSANNSGFKRNIFDEIPRTVKKQKSE